MKISLIHQGALGDTVLLWPLLRSLKIRFPHARRTLVMRSSFGKLMVKLGAAEAAADINDPLHTGWFAPDDGNLMLVPHWADCNLLISAVSSGRDFWADHAARICSKAQVVYFEPKPPSDYPDHVTQYHRQQLAMLNLLSVEMCLPIRKVDGPLMIHPGSGGRIKCWSLERFIEVATQYNRLGIVSEFVLGEAELERFKPEDIETLDREFKIHRDLTLVDLAETLMRAAGYLGNDSGVTHLAGALGIPTVAIFGPSDDRQWRPLGPQVRICRSQNSNELRELTVHEVLESMCGMLYGQSLI